MISGVSRTSQMMQWRGKQTSPFMAHDLRCVRTVSKDGTQALMAMMLN